ncbi:helix-turn-helix transcriptional regulator [Staphylococcus saprophyticus]|nr:helix-turn-helix transcriptional regulator [Staphylococcus saprophyticus]
MKLTNEMLKVHKYICLELKNQRLLKQLKQDRVAFDLGISPSYLSNLENGRRNSTALTTYLAIAEYYDVDFNIIVDNALTKMKLDDKANIQKKE